MPSNKALIGGAAVVALGLGGVVLALAAAGGGYLYMNADSPGPSARMAGHDTGSQPSASKKKKKGSSSGSDESSSSSSSSKKEPLKPGVAVNAQPASGGVKGLMNAGTKSGPPPIAPGITMSQCGDLEDGGPVAGPDCFTGTIECGQTIIGHTKGGVDRYNTRFYEQNFCWPGTINRNGGDERVYKFSFPDNGKWIGKVTLDTPCADLDVVAMTWDKSTCPTASTNVAECDSKRRAGTSREVADLITDGKWQDWAIIVEGIGDEEGAFALTMQCKEGLMWY